MTEVTRGEIESVAAASYLSLDTTEAELLLSQVKQVLSYAHFVCTFERSVDQPLVKNKNIFRKDVVKSYDAAILLEQAPCAEGSYFVVPLILDNR